MPPGGARNRSGPQKDPNSLRSAGLSWLLLPSEGYDGPAPEFLLPEPSSRELQVWEQAWRTPQAKAWSLEPWRWRTVAMWVRVGVLCEAPDVNAALLGQLHRFADQIGMTPAGLKDNGWRVAPDVVAERREERRPSVERQSARDRFRVVDGT